MTTPHPARRATRPTRARDATPPEFFDTRYNQDTCPGKFSPPDGDGAVGVVVAVATGWG